MGNLKNDSGSSSPVENARSLLTEAMKMHREGRQTEADALYARCLQLEPGNAKALRLRGILARHRKDLASSVRLLKQATTAIPQDPTLHGELGLSYMAAGDWQLADESFRTALNCDPESRRPLANLGALSQRRGRLAEAIELHRRYLELEPTDLEVRCNLANALMDAGCGEEALAECDRTLAISPGHPKVLATQGAVFCGLEQFERAVEVLYGAVVRHRGDEIALINMAYAHTRMRQYDAAVSALDKAVGISPDNAKATADLAGAHMALGQVAQAIKFCERFLDRHPGERMVLAIYAYALRDAGRLEESRAILNFDELIQVFDLDAPPDYSSLAAFNGGLAAYIQGHASILNSPVSKATMQGDQTGELDLDESPELAALGKLIDQLFRIAVGQLRDCGFSTHPTMAYASDSWSLRVWGVVLGEGGRQAPHLHPMGWMSGVYYVSLPADMQAAGPQAGWLEFGAPPDRLTVTSEIETRTIEPVEGRLVLFPSYLYHRTLPFESVEPRISVSFDVVPKLI
jgi:uncharacterized protein (TIGR02466 family)